MIEEIFRNFLEIESLNDLNEDINHLSIQFQKPILIAETAYPFTLNWNDNINNILLKALSILALVTSISGITLFFVKR